MSHNENDTTDKITGQDTPAEPARQDAPPAKPKRRVPLWGKVLLGIVCAAAVLVGVAALYVNGKLDLIHYDDGTVDSVGSIGAEEDQYLDTTGLEENTGEMVMPEGSPFQDSNVLNILLISTDERTEAVNDYDAYTHLDELDGTTATTEFSDDARADSLILVSLNIAEDTIKLVSIERGTGVPILLDGYEGQYDWITHTFRYGGAKLTMDTVEECFNVVVDHYVRINFNSFVQIVDAVGGVDITLTEEEAAALNWEIPSNSMKIDVEVTPGVNHMDGYTALQYARLRSVDNDWVRIQRQRTVIQAVLDQIKTATPLELDSLLNAVLPLVQTNFTRSEIAALLVQLPGFLGVTAEQMSLPAEGTYGSRTGMDGRQMYDPDWAENVAILHDFLYGEDSDSDAYAHEEEVETSLNDYTDNQLADMADYMAANSMAANSMAANSMAADLADGTGLWPGEAELAAAAADAATGEDAQQAEPAQAADGDAVADGQQVWLAGFDTAADSLAVYQSMVQHLHETEGVNTLLTEDGFAAAAVLDAYVNGGDETLLTALADALGSTDDKWTARWQWVREYNAAQPEGSKLRVAGLGPDASPQAAALGVSLLRADGAAATDSVADIADWLDRNDAQPAPWRSRYILLRLTQAEQEDPEALQALFGDNYPLIQQLCRNYETNLRFWNGEGTDEQTAGQMYDNFCAWADFLPEDAGFFGGLSMEAASATALVGKGETAYTTFAALLDGYGSPVQGSVQAVGVLYVTSDGDTGSCLPNDRTVDYPLLEACLPDAFARNTWIALDGGSGSPFARSVPLFQPGTEDAGAAAEYFPALLTVVDGQ